MKNDDLTPRLDDPALEMAAIAMWRNGQKGRIIPQWNDLSSDISNHYRAAARCVVDAYFSHAPHHGDVADD